MNDLFYLSPSQLARIKPYFPLSHGVPRVDDLRVISGIIHFKYANCTRSLKACLLLISVLLGCRNTSITKHMANFCHLRAAFRFTSQYWVFWHNAQKGAFRWYTGRNAINWWLAFWIKFV